MSTERNNKYDILLSILSKIHNTAGNAMIFTRLSVTSQANILVSKLVKHTFTYTIIKQR